MSVVDSTKACVEAEMKADKSVNDTVSLECVYLRMPDSTSKCI